MSSPPPQWAFIPEPASSNVSENEEEMEETRVKEKPKPKRRAADPVSAQPKKKQRMESGSKLVGPARLGPPSKINMTPASAPAASTSTSHNQRNRNAAMPARKPSAEDRVAAELNNSFSSSTATRKRTKKEIMKREHAVAGVDKDTAIVVSSSDSEKEPFGGKIPGAGPPSRPSPLASATKGKDDKVARAGPSSRPHLTSSASAPVPKTAPAPLEVIEISDSDDELPPKPKPVARPRPSTSSHPPPNSRPVSNSALAGDYEDLILDGSGNNMDAAMDEDMDMMLDPPFAPSPSKESSITVPVLKKNEKKLSLSSFFSRPPAPSTATAPRSASTSNSNSASAKPVTNGSASASSHPRLKRNPGALSAPPTTMAQPMVISSDSDPDSDSKEASQRPLTATEPVFTRAIVPDTRPTSAAVSSKRSTVVPDSRPSSAAASSKPKESSTEANQVKKSKRSKGREKARIESEDESQSQWIDSLTSAFDVSGEANSNFTPSTKVSTGKDAKKPLSSSASGGMSFAEAFTKATKANFAPDAAVTVKKPSSSASQKPRSSSGSSASTSGAGGSGPHSKPLSSSRPSMGSSNPLVQKDLSQRVKASKPTSKSRGKVYSEEEREQRIKRFDMIAYVKASQSQPTVNEEDEDELNGIGKETGLPGDALGTAPYPRLSSTSSRQPARPSVPLQGAERMVSTDDGDRKAEAEQERTNQQKMPRELERRGQEALNNSDGAEKYAYAEAGGENGNGNAPRAGAEGPGQEEGIVDELGLPPLDYVDSPPVFNSDEEREGGRGGGGDAMQVDPIEAGAGQSEASGDHAVLQAILQANNMQMNGNDDDDSDYSERHVEHMVDVRNEPGSPLSSVSSMARAVDLTEPMVEVPVTDTELPERSRSSSSQASTTDVAKRRWPSRNTKSRRASSSYSSVSEYDRTLLGNYDSTSSASSIANESPPRSTTPEDEKDHLPPLSYGGLPVFTWARRRASLRYEPPRYRLSKDLSHVMHDYINAYDPGVRNHPQMQEVYEWMIQENTCLDEPDAPVIKVINQTETALTEPTPPWEFVYTNEMWLGQDVSPPSRENLVACDCEGKCTRNTCKCWKKQEALTADFDVKGFMYDQNGLLKRNGLPVFECNSLCNCGEECKNRVVSQGRKCNVVIKKTRKKGWGVFAAERIPKGMFIGIYSGELLGHAESEERAVKYDEFGRTYLFDIDWWYITAEVEAKEAKEKKDAAQMAAENSPEPTSDPTSVTPVKDTSSDKDDDDEGDDSDSEGEKRRPSKYTVDAYHAGNFTRFLNHSCDPNAALTPVYIDEADIERPLLTIFSKREIKMNEEITFSYSGDPDEDSDNEEMLPLPQTPRRGQKGKNAHKPLATPKKKGKKGDARVHVDCECKSLRCKGTIWRYD